MQQANSGTFRSLAEPLARELVEALDIEHRREIEYMYKEQLQLRAELERVVELMQKEIVPRERLMHEMIENMQKSYEAATAHMHASLTDHMGKSKDKTSQTANQRKQLVDPLREMENELNRISKLLSHGPVAPEIRGWKPSPGQSGLGGTASPTGYGGSPVGYGGSPAGYPGGTGSPYPAAGAGTAGSARFGNLV